MQHLLQQAQNEILKYKSCKLQYESTCNEIVKLQDSYILSTNSRDFLSSFSLFLKEKIKSKTEELANSALKCVFSDKEMSFRIIPNQTKRGLQYDLYIATDGNLTPLQDCKGGGVLDIISLALLISFLIINSDKTAKVLFLDEPLKNLDKTRLGNAVLWLKGIAKEFQIQFIIVSHEDDIIENADKIILCTMMDGESVVT